LVGIGPQWSVDSVHLGNIIDAINNGQGHLFKQINLHLLFIASNKVLVEDYKEMFELTSYSNSIKVLTESYKEECPVFYEEKVRDRQSDKEIGKSIYSTLMIFLELYSQTEEKPILEINCFSGVSDETMVEDSRTEGTFVPPEEFKSIMNEYTISEINKKPIEIDNEGNKDNFELDDEFDLDFDFINKGFLNYGEAQLPPKIPMSNEEYVKRFMRNDHRGFIVNDPKIVVDYSVSPNLFSNFDVSQSQRGICYAVSATMLYSFHINRLFNYLNHMGIVKNGENPRLERPLNFVQVALCSSSEANLSDGEAMDFLNINMKPKSYNIYNKGEGGQFFASAIWISHHLSELMLSNRTRKENSDDIMKSVPKKNSKEHLEVLFSDRCKNYNQENSKLKVGFTEEEIMLINKYTKKEFSKNVFKDRDSVINQLLEHGPFAFFFTFDLTNKRIFQSMVGKQVLTLKLQQTLKDMKVMSNYGFHAVVAVGIKKFIEGDVTLYTLKFRNSYGLNWGDQGYGYLELDDGLYTGLLKANNKQGRATFLTIN